jgi:hypothetical protein
VIAEGAQGARADPAGEADAVRSGRAVPGELGDRAVAAVATRAPDPELHARLLAELHARLLAEREAEAVGAIADVPDAATAFSQRDAMFEFVAAARWTEPRRTRPASPRRAATAPHSSRSRPGRTSTR